MDQAKLQQLLNEFQRDLPLVSRPFALMAERLGVSEHDVLVMLRRLQAAKIISRVGPVFKPNRVGASTLAAMAVPADDLERAAERVSAFTQVNHNYEREHELNLWFVVTAADEDALIAALADIERAAGYPLVSLPLVKEYHIDLGFALRWN